MKGIVLAGGRGTRLYPLTLAMSKQLLPVHNKPMVYYPLSMLLRAGIREILLISSPEDLPGYRRLLGDGSQWGVSIDFAEQTAPRGLADAFVVGREFIGSSSVCLLLGDNIFSGQQLDSLMTAGSKTKRGGLVFAYPVPDPERFGVVEFDAQGKAISLEEKPKKPKSNFAVPGIYFYDNSVVEYAAKLKPSPRGEVEITDLNRIYLEKGLLQVKTMNREIVWLDAGTHESLLEASNYVKSQEISTSSLVGCPEEVAFQKGFISVDQLKVLAKKMEGNCYGDLLLQLATRKPTSLPAAA